MKQSREGKSPSCFDRNFRNKSSLILKGARPSNRLWIYGFVCTARFIDHEYLMHWIHLKALQKSLQESSRTCTYKTDRNKAGDLGDLWRPDGKVKNIRGGTAELRQIELDLARLKSIAQPLLTATEPQEFENDISASQQPRALT